MNSNSVILKPSEKAGKTPIPFTLEERSRLKVKSAKRKSLNE